MNAVVKHEPREVAPIQSTTPAQLLSIAVQQGADLDKLQKLMDLQERWEANEARKAFTVAMTAFKAEPVEILKGKLVSFTTRSGDTTSYKHAELSDITDAVGPLLSKHDLSFRWDVHQKDSGITVDCVLTHVAGHSERVTMTAPPDASGGKNAIQQIASTTTYLQRYTLLAITGMSTKGMDDDGRSAGGDDGFEADWLAAIEACADEASLHARKVELINACGGSADKVPAKLRSACTAKTEALKKAAK